MEGSASGELIPKKHMAHAKSELPWLARFESLKSQGYLLRPRYRPGWTPSWTASDRSFQFEDSITPDRENILDAERISDGRRVILKVVRSSSPEVKIGRYLSSETLRKDPMNHSIPLLDTLSDVTDPTRLILVLPILREIDEPLLASARECVEFVSQTLEGLVFLHEHQIAHRDCTAVNIMMDARSMFPLGWHAMHSNRFPDGSLLYRKNADKPSRTAAGNVTYYYIDFGISSHGENQTTGMDGQERAPELSASVAYDPYKLDVYILGMAYQRFLLEKHNGLDFMRPLVTYMTPSNPQDRPSAVECLERFDEIRAFLTPAVLAQRLPPNVVEPILTKLFRDGFYWIRDSLWTLRRPHALGPLP